MLVGVDDGRAGVLSWTDARWVDPDQLRSYPPRPASVSGLCFSDDDRFLAASMWSTSQHYAPTMLLDVDGTRLSLRQLFNYRGVVPYGLAVLLQHRLFGFTATGVLLHDGYVITRRHRTSRRAADVLVVDRLPSDLGVRATNTRSISPTAASWLFVRP